MDISIRQIQPGDINYLTDIEIKSYEGVRGLDWWREVLDNPKTYSAVAAIHKVPVGFIVWRKISAPSDDSPGMAEIERLAVKPAFRGHGAGTQLLQTAAVETRLIGLNQLKLVVPESLCFPGHPDDISAWLLKRNLRATDIIPNHFQSYGIKEDAFVFLGPGPA